MDKIYGFHKKTSSKKLNLKEHFEEYGELADMKRRAELKSNNDEKAGILAIMQMDINDENYAALSEYCSIDELKIPGENTDKCIDASYSGRKDTYEMKDIPKDVDLQTLIKPKERLEKKQRPPVHSLKYKGEINIQPDKKEETERSPMIQPGSETLVFVRIYEPFKAESRSSTLSCPKIQTSQVIAILGSQTLVQLRDLISCSSDLSISTEVSEDPAKAESKILAKDVYKSGFFYIEETFYNDLRDPDNKDNSEVIREWAKSRNLGPFQTAPMENVTINSLTLRFGYPWVYQHQGTCEHLIVFSDARLIGPSDDLSVSNYPRVHKMRAGSTKFCIVCGVFPASWITKKNERLPHDPSYFCNTCFHSFNYIDGKKIGNFEAYPIPSNTDASQD